MPRQRLLLFASWIVTTLFATFVSAAGVSIVTRDVTDSHTPALRSTDVIALLATPPPPQPAPAPAPLPPPSSSADVTPVSDTVAPAATDPPATTAPPATPAPPLAGARAETYWSEGGSMTVACLAGTIALVSARPHDGFRFVVDQDGPDLVHVRFEADDDRDGLAAACHDGAPVEAAAGHRGDPGGDDGESDGDRGRDGFHDNGDDWGSGDDDRRGGR